MTEKIKAIMGKYSTYDWEKVQFAIPTQDNPYQPTYTLFGKKCINDRVNFCNELAELEEEVNNEFSDKKRRFDYSEDQLQKELNEYVKNADEANKMHYVGFHVSNFHGDVVSIRRLYKGYENIYAEYIKELIAAKKANKDLEQVKKPNKRKSVWKQLFGKDLSRLLLKEKIEKLNHNELEVVEKLFEQGLPTGEAIDKEFDKYQAKAGKLRGRFGHERREQLFASLMKQHGKALLEDQIVGSEYATQGKLPITGKEKAEFDTMSLAQVIKHYGVEQMWTQKGIALVCEKIKEARDDPKKLAETLISARSFVHQRLNCTHVPMANREFLVTLVGEQYKSLPKNPEYGKFSEVDKQFRKLFAAMVIGGEAELIDKIVKANPNNDFIKSRFERFNNMTASLQEYLNQTVDYSAAKDRLQHKFADKDSARGDLSGGFIAANKHAEAAQKVAELGIPLKEGSASIDFNRKQIDAQLVEKSDKRIDTLLQNRNKRSKTR